MIPFPFWVQGEECGSGGTMRVKTGEPTVLKSRTSCFKHTDSVQMDHASSQGMERSKIIVGACVCVCMHVCVCVCQCVCLLSLHS